MFAIKHRVHEYIVAIDSSQKNIEAYLNMMDFRTQEDFEIVSNKLSYPFVIVKYGRKYFFYGKKDFRNFLQETVKYSQQDKRGDNFSFGKIYIVKEKYYSNNYHNNMDQAIENIELTNKFIKDSLENDRNKGSAK